MAKKPSIKNADIKDYHGDRVIVDEYLEHGRDGIVYKGRLEKVEETVAIKFYVGLTQGSFWASPGKLTIFRDHLKSRFQTELKRLRNLNHPHLQQYITAGEMKYAHKYFEDDVALEKDESVPFIVSRFIPGEILSKRLESKSITSQGLVEILSETAEALIYLHKHETLHGDADEKAGREALPGFRADDQDLDEPRLPAVLQAGPQRSDQVDGCPEGLGCEIQGGPQVEGRL